MYSWGSRGRGRRDEPGRRWGRGDRTSGGGAMCGRAPTRRGRAVRSTGGTSGYGRTDSVESMGWRRDDPAATWQETMDLEDVRWLAGLGESAQREFKRSTGERKEV